MASSVKVLIVEDEPNALMGLAELISGWGYQTETAQDGVEGWEKALAWNPAIVVSDLKMPRLDGIGLLTKLTEEGSSLSSSPAVVVLTAMGSIQLAVEAMKLGAYDFLQKPVDATRLKTILANATRQRETAIELEVARRRLRETGVLGSMVGNSQPMREIFGLIEQIAPSNVSVLITGESGTGKELVAHALHAMSQRAAKPFVDVNCAAIPEDLIESELFGHMKGSFTAAHDRKIGKFQKADGGTLFLDEVGDMSLKTQAKVLRVLEEQRFEPVGAHESVQVDVRVVAATNKNLEQEIDAGNFREALFYRLNVIPFHVPPLRERKEDIGVLAAYFLGEFTRAYGRKPKELTPAALELLREHRWPGNVRELRNLMERVVILHPQSKVDARHIPPLQTALQSAQQARKTGKDQATERYGSLQDVREAAERDYILRKLEEAGGNVSRAAELLGLERSNLYRKMKTLGIAPRE